MNIVNGVHWLLASALIGILLTATDTAALPQPCFAVSLPDSVAEGIQYASDKAWYRNDDGLQLLGDDYLRFGYSRSAESLALEPKTATFTFATAHDGVPVYVKHGTLPKPRFIYVLLNAQCDFQVYAQKEELR